jgi:hypothetical protein
MIEKLSKGDAKFAEAIASGAKIEIKIERLINGTVKSVPVLENDTADSVKLLYYLFPTIVREAVIPEEMVGRLKRKSRETNVASKQQKKCKPLPPVMETITKEPIIEDPPSVTEAPPSVTEAPPSVIEDPVPSSVYDRPPLLTHAAKMARFEHLLQLDLRTRKCKVTLQRQGKRDIRIDVDYNEPLLPRLRIEIGV